ncbi:MULTISPECIES: hypothetical protein [Alcaligenes]|uniref:hypothetical protein n=1 Tax=Alcaligenes TaxID=507 RepID=UPI0010CBC366|nr:MULTISPECIES: hypothetical protein [Alcaligenes]
MTRKTRFASSGIILLSLTVDTTSIERWKARILDAISMGSIIKNDEIEGAFDTAGHGVTILGNGLLSPPAAVTETPTDNTVTVNNTGLLGPVTGLVNGLLGAPPR